MPKSPTRAAIDRAIGVSLAPDLKSRGFRKRQLAWRLDDGHRRLDVVVDPSQANAHNRGLWRVTFMWALRTPTSDRPLSGQVPLGCLDDSLRPPSWDWSCDLGEANAEQVLATQVATDWAERGGPFLDACTDAISTVSFLVDHSQSGMLEFGGKLVGSAIQCGDQDLILRAVHRLRRVFDRNEQDWAGWEPTDRLIGFWGFFALLAEAELSGEVRSALGGLLEGLERPDNPGAAVWYDTVANASSHEAP